MEIFRHLPQSLYSLQNAMADHLGEPPKNSPYILPERHKGYVKYVKGTNFQKIVDLATGKTHKTRTWLSSWRQIKLAENREDVEVLREYLGCKLQIEGVSDVYAICSDTFTGGMDSTFKHPDNIHESFTSMDVDVYAVGDDSPVAQYRVYNFDLLRHVILLHSKKVIIEGKAND